MTRGVAGIGHQVDAGSERKRVQGRGDVEHGLEDVSALALRIGRIERFVGAGDGAWFTRSAIPVGDPETHLAGRRGLTAGVFRGPGRKDPLEYPRISIPFPGETTVLDMVQYFLSTRKGIFTFAFEAKS